MATCDQLRTWLAQAETALHDLTIGSKVEQLRHGEKSLQYAKGDMDKLQKYVAQLRQQVDICDGTRQFRRGLVNIIPVDSNS